jgi:chaperonin GroES
VLDNGDVRPVDLKVGDQVLFGKYGGTEIKIDGEELLVMREDDVMGVFVK